MCHWSKSLNLLWFWPFKVLIAFMQGFFDPWVAFHCLFNMVTTRSYIFSFDLIDVLLYGGFHVQNVWCLNLDFILLSSSFFYASLNPRVTFHCHFALVSSMKLHSSSCWCFECHSLMVISCAFVPCLFKVTWCWLLPITCENLNFDLSWSLLLLCTWDYTFNMKSWHLNLFLPWARLKYFL